MSATEPQEDGVPLEVDETPELEPQPTHPLATALQTFVDELWGLREVMPLLSETAKDAEKEARKSKVEELAKHRSTPHDDDYTKELPDRHRLAAGKRTNFLRPQIAATGLRHAERDLGSATLLMMGAHFDRFVGDIVRAAFEIRPNMHRTIEREISFAHLNDLGDIAAIREFMIEREIEDILGHSRSEQIGWFESQCGMRSLDEVLALELSEVAALHAIIAHHGGRVTTKPGRRLPGLTQRLLGAHTNSGSVFITKNDIDVVHDILFLVAIAIAQGVWRNAQGDQGELADTNLHDLTYRLLALEEFELAQRALHLGLTFRSTMSDSVRLVNTINLAQTYKWLGDESGCVDVLAREDWESHPVPFRLSVAVLKEGWSEAENLMQVCAQESLVNRAAFEDWPVYREFRKTDEYRRAFDGAFEN